MLSAALLFVGGCDYIEYHPYDTRVSGPVGVNATNMRRIETATAGRRTVRFAFLSDTQRCYDDTMDAVEAINARGGVDFVIHGGDLSDFGATKEFMWMRDILDRLAVPYVCLIGNHDCLGTGEAVFREVFGEVNFAFTAGDVRFVCLNTNAMEYDYSNPIPDFGFIQRELDGLDPEVGKTVFAMHVRPYEFQFNNNVAEVFEYAIRRFPGLQFCVFGHEHRLMAEELFGDGVMYYGCPDIAKRSYLLFTLNEGGYEYEVAKF